MNTHIRKSIYLATAIFKKYRRVLGGNRLITLSWSQTVQSAVWPRLVLNRQTDPVWQTEILRKIFQSLNPNTFLLFEEGSGNAKLPRHIYSNKLQLNICLLLLVMRVWANNLSVSIKFNILLTSSKNQIYESRIPNIFCCLNENLTTFLYTLSLTEATRKQSVYISRMLLKK